MRTFTVILSLALSATLGAVPLARAEGYGGFRGGINYASFTGDGTFYGMEFPDPRTGFTGGWFIGVDAGKHLGFRADMLYTMKGATSGDSSIKLDYIELAPLLVGRFPLSEKYTFRVFAGPVAGLFVNAEYDNGPVDLDLGDIAEHVEFSGTIGAELNAKAGPYVLLLETRYTRGTRVFEELDLSGEQELDYWVSNAGIAVMAGVMVFF